MPLDHSSELDIEYFFQSTHSKGFSELQKLIRASNLCTVHRYEKPKNDSLFTQHRESIFIGPMFRFHSITGEKKFRISKMQPLSQSHPFFFFLINPKALAQKEKIQRFPLNPRNPERSIRSHIAVRVRETLWSVCCYPFDRLVVVGYRTSYFYFIFILNLIQSPFLVASP